MASLSVFNLARPRGVNEHNTQTSRNTRLDSKSWSSLEKRLPSRYSDDPGPESETDSESTTPSSPEIPLQQLRIAKKPTVSVLDSIKKKAPAAPPSAKRKTTGALQPTSSVTPAAVTAARAPQPKKTASARRVAEAARGWAKTTPHKKRGKRPTPPPMGPRACLWGGCDVRLSDGREIWAHIQDEHNSGRPVRVGKRVKVYKSKEGVARGIARVPVERMVDEDYDGDMEVDEVREEGEIMEVDEREDEALEDDEPGEILEEEREEERVVDEEEGSSKTEQWFDKVPCLWAGCECEIQYIGLRRHIETKHVPLRGAFCPKGCGYWMSRSDMLWRHADKCKYNGEEETEEED